MALVAQCVLHGAPRAAETQPAEHRVARCLDEEGHAERRRPAFRGMSTVQFGRDESWRAFGEFGV